MFLGRPVPYCNQELQKIVSLLPKPRPLVTNHFLSWLICNFLYGARKKENEWMQKFSQMTNLIFPRLSLIFWIFFSFLVLILSRCRGQHLLLLEKRDQSWELSKAAHKLRVFMLLTGLWLFRGHHRWFFGLQVLWVSFFSHCFWLTFLSLICSQIVSLCSCLFISLGRSCISSPPWPWDHLPELWSLWRL